MPDWREVAPARETPPAQGSTSRISFVEASPILKGLVARQNAEEIELKNGVIIAVGTSNFRRVRGITG